MQRIFKPSMGFSLLFIAIYLTACGTAKSKQSDFVYFNNGIDTINIYQNEAVIHPNDLLTIQVFSKTLNQEQAAVFNMPNSASRQAYQVSMTGNIEMPVIGNVKAAGLTIDEFQNLLFQRLTTYVRNPSVQVRFSQFNINVLGEVRSPGTQKFQADKVTIIDAISAAGDLTDYGRRDSITVIREEGGKKIYHKVDLRSRSLFESPVYLLQPNDIVYVSPNRSKLKNLSVDPETQRKTGLFFTAISLLSTLVTLVVTLTK